MGTGGEEEGREGEGEGRREENVEGEKWREEERRRGEREGVEG